MTITEPVFRLGYRPALDGLRGIAVLLVMAFHFRVPQFRAGFLGVDMFFVLSGFLITSLLVQEFNDRGQIGIGRFYVRRALRLFPALWLMILVLTPVLSTRIGHASILSAHVILPVLFYVSNWTRALGIVPFTDNGLLHLWSLSVEEQFYLAWPLLLYLLLWLRFSSTRLVAVPLFLAFVAGVWSFALTRDGQLWYRVAFGTDTRAVGLLLGSGLALAASAGILPSSRRWVLTVRWLAVAGVIGLSVITYGKWDEFPMYGLYGFALADIIFTFVVAAVAVCPMPPWARILEWRPLVFIGTISYGLYLWHFTFALVLDEPLPWPVAVAVGVPLSFLFAWLSFRLIEKPALRLKVRYTSARYGSGARTTASNQ